MKSTSLALGMMLIVEALLPPCGVRADEFPSWAFAAPSGVKTEASDENALLSVPGSSLHFTEPQIHTMSVAVDWFPAEHPTMPDIVGDRHSEKKPACAYCHLPNGSGRPENAKLAGLPADYILAQVQSFQAGTRQSALKDWPLTHYMVTASSGLTDDQIKSAADYFSHQKAKSYVRIVESARVPQHEPGLGLMLPLPGKPVPLGMRIVEMPIDVDRFEARDPHTNYVAYVPIGSLERGKRLAATGADRTQACATCHGAGLRGDDKLPGPPLAGRTPGYLFRQLYAFQTGARGGDAAQPMQSVVAHLTQADMVALAAYAASLKP